MQINLSFAKKVKYPLLPSKIGQDELEEQFLLSKDDLKFLKENKQKTKILPLAVLLKTYQYLHYFPSKISIIPKEILDYISLQVEGNVKDIQSYDKTPSLKHYHSKVIRKYMSIFPFDSKKRIIEDWIRDFSTKLDKHNDIVKDFIRMLIIESFELPPLSTIEKLVSHSLDKANKDYFKYINKALTKKQKQMIDNVIKELDGKKGKSAMNLLKLIPSKPNINTLNSLIVLLNQLKSFNLKKDVMEKIPVAKREAFSKLGKEYNIKELRRFSAEKRYTLVSCFVYKNYQETIDNIAWVFIKIIRGKHNSAKERLKLVVFQRNPSTSSSMRFLQQIIDIILDNWEEKARIFKKRFIDFKQKEEYEKVNAKVKKLIESGNHHYKFLINYFSYIRRFSKTILNTLGFDSDTKNNPLIKYIDIIRKNLHATKKFTLREVEIPERWRIYVFEKGSFNWKYFELYVLSELSNALQSGDIWIEDAKEYSSIYDHIISEEEWGKTYKNYFKELGWSTDKKEFSRIVKTSLAKNCNMFNNAYHKNKYLKIRNNRLSITPFKKREVPISVMVLKQKIVQRMGDVDLTNILVDVQNWLDFCEHFKHASGIVRRNSKDTVEKILATLHSYGCNLGPSQTAKSSKYGAKQVINIKKFFLTERNLRDANNELVNSYHKISIGNRWGDGNSVSADGRLIRMTQRNLMASWNVKYKGIGGMLYTHVSDKYIAIFSQFINCGVYEAEYVLDALFNEENDIDIKPDTIHVDTHGQTEMLFGFCYLLGINLMPRIKNIGDYTLYKSDYLNKYKYIDSIFDADIDWNLIEKNLFNLMRIIASIRSGKVRSSFILKKLRTYRKANKIFLAFRELGRAARTIYILQYANSIEIRRMVQEGCNKAELWHLFQKFVYFGQGGELRTNDLEDQRNSTTALELVCNCIAYWNAFMIENTVKQMIKEKDKIRLSDVGYMTPLITQHINRFGRFEFDLGRRNKLLE